MSERRQTTDVADALDALDRPDYAPGAGISTRVELLREARDEIRRLRQALAEIAFRPDVVPYKPGAMVAHAEDALHGKR